jgi:hypothetical protein
VIGAVRIRRDGWSLEDTWTESHSRVRVPIEVTTGLDCYGLRGRRIAKSAGVAFESIPAGFFCILRRDGQLVGGRRPRHGHSDETIANNRLQSDGASRCG